MEIPSHVDCNYVAKHLWRIDNTYRNNPAMQDDCRYRIAEYVFNSDYPLTGDMERLKKFIYDFYASEAGVRALADKNNHW
jgi:hypothetical protein